MQTLLRDSAANIRTTFTGPEGEAVEPTTPVVTVTRDSDGEVIVNAENGTDEGDGSVAYQLSAELIPEVDLLHVRWSAADSSAPADRVAVVGGFLCTLEEIEVSPAAAARRVREQAEQWIEDACHVAFRPSYHRETLHLAGERSILPSRPLVRSIRSAGLNGITVDPETLTVGENLIGFPSAWRGTATIAYEHGYIVAPEPIRRAVVKLAQHLSTAADSRISRFREDDQEVWLSVPGVTGETGIPEVDSAIAQYRVPSVG